MSGAGIPVPESRTEKRTWLPSRRHEKRQSSAARLHELHRFARVENEVEQHLLQLYAVGQNRRELASDDRVRRYASRDQFGVRQLEHLGDELVGVDRDHAGLSSTQQGAQPANHLRGAPVFRQYVAERGVDLRKVDRATPEEMSGRFGIVRDRRQRLIELVREGARQLAERVDAREVG